MVVLLVDLQSRDRGFHSGLGASSQ